MFSSKIETLSISHRSILQERFNRLDLDISEYNFSNLFCFRHVHQYEVIFNDDIFIKGRTYDNKSYLMPTSDIRSFNDEKLLSIIKHVDFIFPIPEEWIKKLDPTKYVISTVPEDDDYIYNVEKLATYSGGKLSYKRNLVHQFLDQYEVESKPFTSIEINDALMILDEWSSENKDKIANDSIACKEAIHHVNDLSLKGTIFYVGKKPAAFIMGDKLNSKIFALHFAKASLNFKGIYQYIYQEFAKGLQEKYQQCNMEQDLGDLGLRQSKKSYFPEIVLKKYRVGLI